MALRIASILGLSCQPWLVLGATEIEKEFFPLSGGIDNGVQVTIKVKGIQAEGATIEFVNRERKAAFTFTVRSEQTPKTITRSADAAVFSGAMEQDFGGFPAELCNSGSCTFTFTKRKFDMAVSIATGAGEVVRYPWYDYTNLVQMQDEAFPLLTHVAVYSGMMDPEVTLERPTCSQKCLPDECRDAEGRSTCADESGGCFTVTMGSAPGVATQCSANTETSPGGGMHCCDGREAPPKARDSLGDSLPDVKPWATITDNVEYIKRVCKAFAFAACPEGLAGTKVRVDRALENMTYKVFSPASVTQRTDPPNFDFDASASLTVSPFGLFESFDNEKVTQSLTIGFPSTEFNADAFHDNIISAVDGSNLTVGMYVHLIKWEFPFGAAGTGVSTTMVTKYTRRVRDLVSGQSNSAKQMAVVYASQIPITDNIACEDRPMNDTLGGNCATYSEELCNTHGYPTEAGCTKWGDAPGCDMPRGVELGPEGTRDLGRSAAALACCVCGGGDSVLPTDWAPDSSSLLDIVM